MSIRACHFVSAWSQAALVSLSTSEIRRRFILDFVWFHRKTILFSDIFEPSRFDWSNFWQANGMYSLNGFSYSGGSVTSGLPGRLPQSPINFSDHTYLFFSVTERTSPFPIRSQQITGADQRSHQREVSYFFSLRLLFLFNFNSK